MPFPTQVNVQPAPGVPGDFASSNPRSTVIAGPGGLIAGAAGVTVAKFAWVDPTFESTVSNTGFGPVTGFVGRLGQMARVTNFLADSSMVIQQGTPVTLWSGGDFWAINGGTGEALYGQKAYANFADGSLTFAATASAKTATAATSSIAAGTAISVTGSISGNILTVTAVSTGTVYPGAILAGGTTATGTQVTAQISGTAGGVGTYYVNIPDQTVVSGTITGTYGVLTLGAVPSATFQQGSVLSGSGVTAGTTVWQLLSGTGGNGSTYVVSPSQTASSTTITATLNVETKWFAVTSAPAGGLVKISSITLG